jgi:5-amino-6-(5-phospho-D-ribitylamino)uracil phosphatase
MKPSHWRIVACDLDGTLIGWNHKINARDLDALRRAREAGIHVAICTGRNSRECAGVISALQAEGLGVFVNGAMVCAMADGKAVYSTFLADDLVFEAIDFFGQRGHAVLVLADDRESRLPVYCLTDHGPPHQGTTDWLAYNRVHAEPTSELPASFRGRVVRVGVVINVSQAADLERELLRDFGHRSSTHSIYSPHYDCQVIEVFHQAVNKWTGLEHLAEQLSVESNRIIAIGDDVNDLAMLRGAGLSFAMGDASPAIQREAKCITGKQADCGVAQVIDALLEGELEPDPSDE